jgi:response regulator RpfG family c-di-GMP phosphodiesterase
VKQEEQSTRTGILFVDDEEHILKSMRRLFMSEEWSLHTASSGPAGLQILDSEHDIGVVVSDQKMPEMNGVDFLEMVGRKRPDCLRILLTGYSNLDTVKEAINRGGAYRYFTKPWKNEELVQTVREAVQRYELLQENRRLTELVHAQNRELKKWNTELEKMVCEKTVELTKRNSELKDMADRQYRNYKNVIGAMSGLIELKDKRIRSHSRSVAEITASMAKSMRLERKDFETVIVASLLHDIGKIGIPDAMMLKDEEELKETELTEYQLHPVRGQAILEGVEDLRPAGVLIRHHHERFDGTGYPDRISGEKIPLGSRVIAVADMADYWLKTCFMKEGVEEVIERIRDDLGKRFDPKLLPHVRKAVMEVCDKYVPDGASDEMELRPEDLKPGYVVSRDVKSGTGVLLVPSGVKLTQKNIETLRRMYMLDPSRGGIFVWTGQKGRHS